MAFVCFFEICERRQTMLLETEHIKEKGILRGLEVTKNVTNVWQIIWQMGLFSG